MPIIINTLNTNITTNDERTKRPSPYRAVNTLSLSVIKTSQLMLYREIIAVCSEMQAKHINAQ